MITLSPGSYLVRPFKTYKGHTHSYTYEGTNVEFLSVNEALIPPADWLYNEYPLVVNTNGILKYNLYKSVEHLFYYETSSRFPPRDDREWALTDTNGDGVYVVNISQYSFGETVRPTSFRLTSAASTASIYDDGTGKLICSSDTNAIIGNIFYSKGIAVIGKMDAGSSEVSKIISHEGLYLDPSDVLTISYESQNTLFEHITICTIDRGELNCSTNATLRLFESSSVSGSTGLIAAINSGSLPIYMTTIGLYNDDREILAIAKLPRPIKRVLDIAQTFVVKFDI